MSLADMSVPFFPTATVDVKRPGVRGGAESTVSTGRHVQLDWPSRQERVMAGGAEVPIVLWDVVDADYQTNDVVILTALDSGARLPAITKYRVGLVERTAPPPPLPPATTVYLTGEGGYV